MCTAIPESLARRQALAFAGFKYRAGAWIRGTIELDEELLDHLDEDTWQAYLGLWQKGETMQREQWRSATGDEIATSPRPLERQAIDVQQGIVKGIAVTWDHVIEGRFPTVFHQGAFTSWIRSHPPSFHKLLWAHDDHEPLGVMTRVEERAGQGLYIEARVPLTDKTRHYLTMAKEGVATALSIGWTPDPRGIVWEHQDGRQVRHVKADAQLFEASLCLWGLDEGAAVTEVQRRHGGSGTALLPRHHPADVDLNALTLLAADDLVRTWSSGQTLAAIGTDRLAKAESQYQELYDRTRYLDVPERLELRRVVRERAAVGAVVVTPRGLLATSIEDHGRLAPLVAKEQAARAIDQQLQDQAAYEAHAREGQRLLAQAITIKYAR